MRGVRSKNCDLGVRVITATEENSHGEEDDPLVKVVNLEHGAQKGRHEEKAGQNDS